MTNQNLKSPKTPTPPNIGPRSTRATAHYRHAGSCFLGGLATTGPLAAVPGPRAGVPPQRHLANFSSTTIEQLQTPSLSRARQNFDNISRYHPSGNERKNWQKMCKELRENQLRWTFLYDVTFSMVGLGNPVSSFLEMRLPCISKSQATPSHKSLPEKLLYS